MSKAKLILILISLGISISLIRYYLKNVKKDSKDDIEWDV